jgi:hypothetical protein
MVKDAALLATTLLMLAAESVDRAIPQCPQIDCVGKRVEGYLGVLQLCVPAGLRIRKELGEHGDVHYVVTARFQGQSFELIVVSGPYFPGKVYWPDCTLGLWHSPDYKGEDCHVAQDDTKSRYITLNAPMGFAYYRDVPPKVAARFDLVLDSLCWRETRIPISKP